MKTTTYRGRLACFALCLLSAVICPLVFAGGSWIVDGETVQTLEVQTTVDDPAALHTDGSRSMAARLDFDNSVSSASSGLVQAYIPWEGLRRDLFIMDDDNEVLWLSTSQNVNLGVGDMVITPYQILNFSYGTSISFEEHLLNGGWAISSVMNDPLAIMNRSYADNRYILKSAGITVTHTIQAGDVLQIQNGVITAINP